MRVIAAFLLAAGAILAQPDDPRTKWFRDAKFGMFVHWGPYSVIGRHEWARQYFQIPQAEYDVYARQFNPVNFNADEWVDAAKNAGARYMVITSKHHDGFAIFRSKVSDYDMEITPYSGDPLKMLADSAKRKGMRLGFYHSIMDWHHPDYRPRRSWEYPNPNEGGNNPRYVEFLKAQIQELMTGYGDVAVMWFDGEWEHTLRDLHKDDEVYDFIRKIQPNTLINDRLYERKPGNRADFGTPEQFVPATGVRSPDGKPVLWEACVTINGDSWGYNKYETDFKTSRDLIRMLSEVVSKGGNLLLNVGPQPDGKIQTEFTTRLAAIGAWMKVNSEAIYGTTASPFDKLPFFGRATVKGDELFLHVYQWPRDGRLRIPGLKNEIRSARVLGMASAKVASSRDGQDWILQLPAKNTDDPATVVALKLDGSPRVEPSPLRPASSGVLTLDAASAEIESNLGQRAKKENMLGHVFITRWTRAADVLAWDFQLPQAGRYNVSVAYGLRGQSAGRALELESPSGKLAASVPATGGEFVFKPAELGKLNLAAGTHTLRLKAPGNQPDGFSFEKLILTPAQ